MSTPGKNWADGVWTPGVWAPGVWSQAEDGAPVLLSPIPGLSAAVDTGEQQFDLGAYFSGATSFAIAPALEAGWSFDTNTGELTIDTDDEDEFGPFTVTATNAAGDTDSNTFSVTVSNFVRAGYASGTAVDSSGVLGTVFLGDAEAVPGGAVFIAGIAHAPDGNRYVALWPGSGIVTYVGGRAIRPDGAQCILDDVPTSYHSGVGYSNRGELCVVGTSGPNFVAGVSVNSGRTAVSNLS